MKIRSLLLGIAVIFSVLAGSALVGAVDDDPDIERLYASPREPYQYDEFDIYVRAEDEDGIEKIKLYDGSDHIDTCDCDGDESCSCTFEVYEREAGYHTYKVKVYDEEGDTESETIKVLVLPDEPYYPPYYPLPAITQAYFIPTQPLAGASLQAHMSAFSDSGIQRIEVWHAGGIEGSKYCYNSNACSHTFRLAPRFTPGNYEFTFRVIDRYGRETSVRKTAVVKERYVPPTPPSDAPPAFVSLRVDPTSPDEGSRFYISARFTDDHGLKRIELWEGAKILDSESCSDSRDCSAFFTLVGLSPGSYSFTVKAIDTSNLVTTMSKSVSIGATSKLCAQLGGTCCSYGGSYKISGSSDCPSSCFEQCHAPQIVEPKAEEPSTPSGFIVIAEDEGSFMFFLASLLFLVVSVMFIWHLLRHH